MERFLLYFDDLDDLYGMIGLLAERLRRFLFAVVSYLLLSAGAIAGIGLALSHPPLALATAILLFVLLMYRSVTAPIVRVARTA